MSDNSKAPFESKVLTGTIGAGGGGVFGLLLIWILGVTVWHSSPDAANEANAIASVPTVVTLAIGAGLPAGLTLFIGWATKHTPRLSEVLAMIEAAQPDVPAPAPAPVVTQPAAPVVTDAPPAPPVVDDEQPANAVAPEDDTPLVVADGGSPQMVDGEPDAAGGSSAVDAGGDASHPIEGTV